LPTPWRLFLIALFSALDLVPLLEDGVRRGGIACPENVRMPPHELVADAASDVFECETACFFGDFTVEDDLQQ
jgi:hypothetical protein